MKYNLLYLFILDTVNDRVYLNKHYKLYLFKKND